MIVRYEANWGNETFGLERRVQMLFLAEFGEPLMTLWTP